MDHFFGISAVLEYFPEIPIVIPESFTPHGYEIL